MPRPFDPAIDADLKANYRSRIGPSPQSFADKHGVSLSVIHMRAHKLGLTCNKQWDKQKDTIIADYQRGDGCIPIGRRYGHHATSVRDHLIKWGVQMRTASENSTRYDIAADTFNRIDSHEKAYWLGFLYADGNVYLGPKGDRHIVQLCLASTDTSHVERFRSFLKSDKRPLYPERDGNAIRFTVDNRQLATNLMALGCVPKKSLTLTFPTEQQVPKQYRPSFVLGYADGDGCITGSGTRWHWTIIGTHAFNRAVQDELVDMAGLTRTKLSVEKRSPDCSLSCLVYGGQLCLASVIRLGTTCLRFITTSINTVPSGSLVSVSASRAI